MTPQEELAALRRLAALEAKASGQVAPQPTQPGIRTQQNNPSDVAEPGFLDEMGRYAKEFGTGLKYSGQRASAGLTGILPRSVEQFLVSKGVSPSQEQLAASKAEVAAAGPMADVGAFAGDVAGQFLPSKKLQQATQGLTAARALAANMAGQGALNAALTPEDRGTAAAIGAGATAAGAGVARVLGGPLRNMVSKEGQTLLSAGIPVTPGQAVSGPNAGALARAIRSTEDKAGSIPIVGDVLKHKAHQANAVFINNEINAALEPLGKKVEGVGRSAIDSAREIISKAYDQALPEITLPATSLPTLVEDAIARVKQTNPLFNTTHEEALRLYDGRRIQELAARGQDISGLDARRLDTELGEYIRKFSKNENNVYNTDLAAGFKAIQDSLRAAMVGATPEAKMLLERARMARARLEPIFQAADSATGEFTAKRLVKTLEKRGTASDVQKAAATVLPNVEPDSGTAGRTILHALLTPAAAGAGAATGAGALMGMSVAPLVAGAAGALAGYSKPGVRFLTEGVHPIIELLRKPQLSRDEVEQVMQFLSSQPLRAGLNSTIGD